MKRTQCPNCLSVFLISDHQFVVSKGKVRCGSCRQPFYAEFLDEPDQVPPAAEPVTAPSATTSAPATAPATAPETAPANAPANARDSDNPTTRTAPTIEPASRQDWQDELRNMQKDWHLDVQANDPVAPEFETEDPLGPEFDTNTISFTDAEYDPRFADNLHSELSIEFDDESSIDPPQDTPAQTPAPETEDEPERRSLSSKLLRRRRQQQLDLEVPAELTDETVVEPGETGLDDQALIQDVDKLIDEKLAATGGLDESRDEQLTRDWSGFDEESTTEVESPSSQQSPSRQTTSEFSLDQKPKAGFFQRWIMRPVLALLCLALLLILLTQLWYRQWLPAVDTPVIKQLSDAAIKPLAHWLQPVQDSLEDLSEQHLGKSIPERRNLARMFLLSSNTEPHPSRSSTILLKVGIVNRAEIPQPWPWLELSLTEENGRLVSRRNLDPADYLHNNDLPDKLAPNELRQVTIELLSFPELATGYELKILNK